MNAGQRTASRCEAAVLLNIPIENLDRLLDAGYIPFHTVGTHRYIGLDNLLAYSERRDRERRQDIAELTRLSQELGLYK
jgi:excisionase family DNA binding protein